MLEIRNLSVGFGDKTVLRDLSLELSPGEIVGLMGASGSGKTTLLRAVAGLAHPDGQAALAWRAGQRPWRSGMVFQEDRLLPWRTIGQNLRLACAALPPPERRQSRLECGPLLAEFGIDGLEHRMPRELSGGMRQRVALIRALLFGRELQLWDEPFQSLDAARRLQVAALVRRRFREQGATALVASHDMTELLCLCDRILVLVPGEGGTALDELPVALSETQRVPDDPAFRARRQALEDRLLRDGVTNPA